METPASTQHDAVTIPPIFEATAVATRDADPALVWEAMVNQAVQHRVSDIHVTARRDEYDLAFRIDGDIRFQGAMAHEFSRRLIGHIRSLAGMDIAEYRRPTEGRTKLEIRERMVDLRVSVVPTVHGQDMVVRILDHSISLMDLNELNMLPEQLGHVSELISRPNGLILVSGPTGSGKTTTLYAMLRRMAGKERKILTIEDPVEYDVPQINQTQVNPKIGVTFAGMLIAILRQDPDVIMVGEIRDAETAMTAVRAANMGNLVLATTHANRASRAVETLLSLGVHPFFMAVALQGVITQVLAKRLCTYCRQELPETGDIIIDDKVRKRIPTGQGPRLYAAQGCEHCHNTGYSGRMGLFEFFVPDEHVKHLIIERRPAIELERAFSHSNWPTLEQVGKLAAVTGETTMEEIVRVMPIG